MNYYEQFYDDLEFDDQYYDRSDDFDARNYRQKPYDRNNRGQNRGHGPNRGQGPRGRGQNWGRGNERGRGGHNQGRGGPGGKNNNFKMTNFVKAGELAPDAGQPVVTYPTQTPATTAPPPPPPPPPSQPAPPQPAQQSDQSFNFSNPYYGYGERIDISGYQQQQAGQGMMYPQGQQAMQGYGYNPSAQYPQGYYQGYQNTQNMQDYQQMWAQQHAIQQMQQSETKTTDQGPPGETMEVAQPTYASPESNSKPKKPMFIPKKMNFVKSTNEYQSTDVAIENRSSTNQAAVTAKTGNRAGLGFGKPPTVINPGPREVKDIAVQDTKFEKLVQIVKDKNKTGKNALEVLHMAVQKVKGMVIDFDISPVVSTVANFQCVVMINGIHVGRAVDSKKKGAKLNAASEAMDLLTCGRQLTVRKSSEGHYELKPKSVDVVHPAMATEPAVKPKKGYTPSQGGVKTTNTAAQKQAQIAAASNQAKEKEAAIQAEAYSKPKIVFRGAGQTGNSKPMTGFVKAGEATTSKPLSGFVKAGQSDDNKNTGKNSESGQSMELNSGSAAKGKKRKDKTAVNADGSCRKGMKQLYDVSQLVLIRYAYRDDETKASILAQSAQFNGMVYTKDFDFTCEGKKECTVSIGGLEVGDGEGETKDEAKENAIDNALSALENVCYTVVCKVKVGFDENSMDISKDKILGGESHDDSIQSSNIGNALLRKMGWVGGGIGKDGTGIAEPVKATGVIGRKGLGLTGGMSKGSDKQFTEKVTKILTDFKNADTDKEIHFSSELTKEERAKIHQMAQRMKLKSISRGTGDDRYLTISHKQSLDGLLTRVIESGGSTDKYKIIPPKNPDLKWDFLRPDAGPSSHSKQ